MPFDGTVHHALLADCLISRRHDPAMQTVQYELSVYVREFRARMNVSALARPQKRMVGVIISSSRQIVYVADTIS